MGLMRGNYANEHRCAPLALARSSTGVRWASPMRPPLGSPALRVGAEEETVVYAAL